MYYNDDSVFNERIPILWSIGYFIVDLVDCGLRGDATYSLHALFCLVLGVSNYTTPVCRELRMKYVTTLHFEVQMESTLFFCVATCLFHKFLTHCLLSLPYIAFLQFQSLPV
jgi:hypothetical protein